MSVLTAYLEEVSDFILDGTHGSPERMETGIPVLSAQNVANGVLDYSSNRFTSLCEYEAFNKRVSIERHDVLLTIVGTIGRSAVVEDVKPAVFQRSVAIIRPNKKCLDARYLYHITQSPEFIEQARKFTKQSTQAGIYLGSLKKIEIPLPPLAEQKRIAAILDKADQLRQKRRQAIALLESLTQSIFLEMFGTSESEVRTIGELISDGALLMHKDGNHGSNYPRAEEFGEEGIPFLSARAIADDGVLLPDQVQYLNTEKAKSLTIGWIKAGDVLLSHNASVGKVGIYRGEFGPALIGTSLTAFRVDSNVIAPEFLYSHLRSDYFQRQITKSMSQTTRNQVPITAQRNLEIRIPDISRQLVFMGVAQTVQARQADATQALLASHGLFSSLQHRAFSGQL